MSWLVFFVAGCQAYLPCRHFRSHELYCRFSPKIFRKFLKRYPTFSIFVGYRKVVNSMSQFVVKHLANLRNMLASPPPLPSRQKPWAILQIIQKNILEDFQRCPFLKICCPKNYQCVTFPLFWCSQLSIDIKMSQSQQCTSWIWDASMTIEKCEKQKSGKTIHW